jgi:Proteasome maturation factor UMP1
MNDESNTIPLMKQPVSVMETGLNGNNLASNAIERHPVDILQHRTVGVHPYHNINFARHVYGSGFAMTLATEQKVVINDMKQRHLIGLNLPGHGFGSTSSIYGDIVTGQDTTIDFSDYLSMPQFRPDSVNHNPHNAMERALNM